MKRQHPDNPDLFWCSKCQTYKAKVEFQKRGGKRGNELQSYCRMCNHVVVVGSWRKYKARVYKKHNEYMKIHPEIRSKANKIYKQRHPEKVAAKNHRCAIRRVIEIKDSYLIGNIKRDGIEINHESIELKREQIQLWRELKQIKQEVNNGTA